MSWRDLGLVDLFQGAVPEVLAFPVALLTQLGAIWFAILVLLGVYRYHDRETAVVIGGVLLAGTATWRFIKEVYVVPRPEQEFVPADAFPGILEFVFDAAVVQAGPGFPSGHAVTTTVLYFSLALYLGWGQRWIRYAMATFLVALVGFTRITLGVHYVTDVIVGALIGHTLLFAFFYTANRAAIDRVDLAYGAAIAAAAIGLLANLIIDPINPRDVIMFGAAVGVYAWWQQYGEPLAMAEPAPIRGD